MPEDKYFEIHDIPFKKEFRDSYVSTTLRVDVDASDKMVLREPNQEERRLLGLPIERNSINERIAVELAKDPTYSW